MTRTNRLSQNDLEVLLKVWRDVKSEYEKTIADLQVQPADEVRDQDIAGYEVLLSRTKFAIKRLETWLNQHQQTAS